MSQQQSPYCLLISSRPFPAWHHQTAALPCAFWHTVVYQWHVHVYAFTLACVCVWLCRRGWSHAVPWRRRTCFMCLNALIISQNLPGPPCPRRKHIRTQTHTHTPWWIIKKAATEIRGQCTWRSVSPTAFMSNMLGLNVLCFLRRTFGFQSVGCVKVQEK